MQNSRSFARGDGRGRVIQRSVDDGVLTLFSAPVERGAEGNVKG
jgi:hypothetical protein